MKSIPLRNLYVDFVGDRRIDSGDDTNLFFVMKKNNVILVTSKFDIAYKTWRKLSDRKEKCRIDSRLHVDICYATGKSDVFSSQTTDRSVELGYRK